MTVASLPDTRPCGSWLQHNRMGVPPRPPMQWGAPPIAVAIYPIRPAPYFTNPNDRGSPSSLEGIADHSGIVFESDIPSRPWNPVVGTLHAVPAAVALLRVQRVRVLDLAPTRGLHDTTTRPIRFHIEFRTGFVTSFMRNFMRLLPTQLLEASRVEGVAEGPNFVCIAPPPIGLALAAMVFLMQRQFSDGLTLGAVK